MYILISLAKLLDIKIAQKGNVVPWMDPEQRMLVETESTAGY